MPAIDPRMNSTIPTTAAQPLPWTPICLDPEKWRRQETDELELRASMLKAHSKEPPPEGEDPGTFAEKIAAEQFSIDQRAEEVRATYAQMKENIPVSPKFFLKIPTSVEREQINSRLTSLGLAGVSQEMIRASMIEAMYEHDWGKGLPADNEAEAEELAGFLDGIWQREEVQQRALAHYQEQEYERILDVSAGAPIGERLPLPPRIISVREQAKAVMLIDTIMTASRRMRDLAARQMDFTRQNALMLVRINLVGVADLVTRLPIEPDPRDKALTEAVANEVLESLSTNFGKVVGKLAWDELCQKIDHLYRLDGFEEKNSDSPLGKLNGATGSPVPSGDTAISGGPSTKSSTGPAPDDGSATIIDKSSTSTTDSSPTSPELNGSQTEEV